MMAVALAAGCSSSAAQATDAQENEAESAARAALAEMDRLLSLPRFEGEGGKGIRLAVLAPEGRQFAPEDAWLPVFVQGILTDNFVKYSAMTIVDRQNLDKVLTEQNLSLSANYSDKDYVEIGQLTNSQYILAGTLIKLPDQRIEAQFAITDTKSGERRASFTKSCTLAQLRERAVINEAAADLLAQMGIQLTASGKQALTQTVAVNGETALAKGITAQTSGAVVEAFSYYFQAASFDLSKTEAAGRINTLADEISTGTVGQKILNDMESRRAWLALFKECAAFFKEHPPFELLYDPNLIQEGETDYAHETANLAMSGIVLNPSQAGFTMLNELLSSLDKTGKRTSWGFKGWPLLDIEPKDAAAVVFGGQRSFSFKIDVAIVNEKGKTIARNTVTLKSDDLRFAAGDRVISPPSGMWSDSLRFQKVSVNDITPVMTVRISGVNGLAPERFGETGYIRIAAVSPAEFSLSRMGFVKIAGGTFMMGSPSSEPNRESNETQHQVTLSSFYMGKHEITQKEWVEVMGSNPSRFKGDNLPVEQVSWFVAVNYCNKRSIKEGLPPAYTVSGTNVTWNQSANGYRLPTEAEWEYACRAGTTTSYSSGESVDSVGWYDSNSGGRTHPVGMKQANGWGLYDMHGNVWEWCWDWYGSYASGNQTDPMGSSSGSSRVTRGESWGGSGQTMRSALRGSYAPLGRPDNLGFRLVRPQFVTGTSVS
jgi:formylglycine-generating enzyme required for sulfatase activity